MCLFITIVLEEYTLIFKYFLGFQILFPVAFFWLTPIRYAFVNALFLFVAVLFGIIGLFDIVLEYSHITFMWSENNSLQESIDPSLNFALTPLSFFFSLLVMMIGCATNLYIIRYFSDEASEKKFIFTLNWFVISMVLLVCANNFYTIFLGWELIGLTSFFLINYWSVRRGTLKSSFKAFSFNLVSDILLLSAFVLFYKVSSTTNLTSFFSYVATNSLDDNSQLYYGLICLILSAGFKSVQMFGHLWLPDSMEAPVPASALIHSATLVSAGIYLLCKFHGLISLFNLVDALATVGAFTAAYGGVVAASQTDVKKLLAYSTMSHSGFLWFLAAVGQGYPILIYLYLHGLFKAMTFFCAGAFIRVFGTQDSRWMGEAHIQSRLDSFLLILCSSNLAGLPFTVGFTNKYFFINMFFANSVNLLSFGLLFIGLLSSLIYFIRIVYFVVFDYNKSIKETAQQLLVTSEHKYFFYYRSAPYNQVLAVFFLYVCALIISAYFVHCATCIFMWEPFITPLDSDYIKYVNFFEECEYYLLFLYECYTIGMICSFVMCWKKRVYLIEGLSIIILFFFSTLFF